MSRGQLDDEYGVKEERDLLAVNRRQVWGVAKNPAKAIFSLLLTFFLAIVNAGTLHPGSSSSIPVSDIESIIGDFLVQLGMSANVLVTIDPHNERLVSVQRVRASEGEFRMSFDESFLAQLDEKELRATIAHEVGHIWIFSHHPYLQTEELANQIALKLVSRESLELIYERVAHTVPRTTLKEIKHLPPPDERITP